MSGTHCKDSVTPDKFLKQAKFLPDRSLFEKQFEGLHKSQLIASTINDLARMDL